MKSSSEKRSKASKVSAVNSKEKSVSHSQEQKDKDLKSANTALYIIVAILGILIAVTCALLIPALRLHPSLITKLESSLYGHWDQDKDFLISSNSNDVSCDFPIIQAKAFDKKRQKNMDDLLDHPFIIRGMMTNWAANENWSKSNFTTLYGNKTIKLGSESSIVYGGGAAGLQSRLADVIEDMDRVQSSRTSVESSATADSKHETEVSASDDSFIFDVSILRSIPELGRDFRVPGMIGLIHLSATFIFLSIHHSLLLCLTVTADCDV
jgi:hypothetical protein